MASLQMGRKIYSINEALVCLWPCTEVGSIHNQSCSHHVLSLMVTTKA